MECELLGLVAAQNVLGGKHYSCGIRAHKITAQAVWKILFPSFLSFVSTKDLNNSQILNDIMNEQKDIGSSVKYLQNPVFREYFSREEIDNPNVLFWWSYQDLVFILLEFTKSEREGLWDLYLIFSIHCSLSYSFILFDHINYAR